MPRPHLPDRRTFLLYLLAVEAYLVMLVYGPWSESMHVERVYTTVLAGSVTLLFAFLTRRIAFSLIVTAWIFLSIEIGSLLKVTYLTTPLLALDLIYFINRDTVEVITRYPILLSACVIGLILVPLGLIGVFRIDRPWLFAEIASAWRRRAIAAAGALFALTLVVLCALPNGPFADVYAKGMWQAMIDRSYLSNFFISFYSTQILPPQIGPNIDPRIVWNEQVPRTGDPTRRPDIIAILEESTFDPRMLPLCNLPMCKRRMFVPDQRTRAHGFLQVHTWGGGTWTAEFALLTGIAHALFGDAGLYAPFNLAPRIEYSLMRTLKADGYRSIVIYPTSGSFINAQVAYDYYGVDRFIPNEDTGLGWESPDTDVYKVFDRVYAQERKEHPDQPLFVFMLTLRQHGPHMTPLKELPPPYNKPLFGKKVDEWLNLNLGNYLYRLDLSDQALAKFEERLFATVRPIVLLHFGDHQPSFDGAINALPKSVPAGIKDPTKVTYYMLKSNFAPREKFDYNVLDIIFLGGLVLDVADLPKNDYYEANSLLRTRCKGRYFDCTVAGMLDSYHHYVFDRLHALHD